MEFLNYGAFAPGGELLKRLELSFKRMTSDRYNPELFLTEEFVYGADWPGDTEGRLLLACAMLSKTLGKDKNYVEKLFEKILGLMNGDGYLGKVIDENSIDEQSLSGNSWLMRGIAEYYEWTKDERAYKAVENMARGLFLKTLGKYRNYPMEKDMRLQNTGAYSGSLTGESANGWLPSTDIGCAFIMMDGVSHAYRILKWDSLYELLSEMIQVFSGVDLMKCAFQTHASLSCARGMLRAGVESGRGDWIHEAVRQFDFYLENGITENYANHNWYTRPEWTEPCAIIDSFILACEIWRLTGKESYLNAAHRILYNAVYRSQRENGGFGCDNCVGADGKMLFVSTYEAWWCCSMRGGDGLSCAARAMAAWDGKTVYLPFFHEGEVCTDNLAFSIESGYPYQGKVTLKILKSDENAHGIALFIPENCANVLICGAEILKTDKGFVHIGRVFRKGDRVDISFDLLMREAPAAAKESAGGRTIRYGTLYLAVRGESETACPDKDSLTLINPARAAFAHADGRIFEPLSHITFEKEDVIQNSRFQLIY